MDPVRWTFWVRRLRPLHLNTEPITEQLGRRRGAVVVASGLLAGFMIFFLAIFAGFGHWEIGAVLDGLFVGPMLGWLWFDHLRLSRRVQSYLRELAGSTNR